MKDNPNRLKKWLFSYFILSALLFFLDHLCSLTSRSFEFEIAKCLIIYGLLPIITFFFYKKITQKSIWWILGTFFLVTFLSYFFALIRTILSNSSVSYVNYIVFSFFWTSLNTLFMFLGAFIQKKVVVKNWEDDILDDTNL